MEQVGELDIKIMRVKENECKEKRIYSWCGYREKDIDVAWGVDAPRASMLFLEEEDHRHERKVTSFSINKRILISHLFEGN